jgi:hypothetical protein
MRGPTDAPSRRAAAINSPYLFLCTHTHTHNRATRKRQRTKTICLFLLSNSYGTSDRSSCEGQLGEGRRDEPPRRQAPRTATRWSPCTRAWSASRRCCRRRAGKRPAPMRPAPHIGSGRPGSNKKARVRRRTREVQVRSQ